MPKQTITPIDLESAGLPRRIARSLLEAILNRGLKGGDRLVETELQKLFGVSRSPLREAFRELEKRGLVEIRPRRGAFVKKVTRRDIEEHYPIQASLEGLAARQAHGRLTKDQRRQIDGCLQKMAAAAGNGETKMFLEHHERFHHVYIENCGNRQLIELIRDLRLRGTLVRYFFLHTPDYCRQSLEVHRRIYEAFCDADADPQQVEHLVRQHIEKMLTMEGWEV